MEKIFQFFRPRKINLAAHRNFFPQNAKPNAKSTKKKCNKIF